MWCEDNLNKKMPLDGPQWRCFGFMYKNPEENNKLQMIQIWKCHHSFMDGVSSMALSGWSTSDYGRHNFIKFKDPSFFIQMALRVLSPLFWVLLCLQTVFTTRDDNVFTKFKKKMTGTVNCASSPIFDMNKVKAVAKAKKITINDFVMCAFSTAITNYMKERGEKVTPKEV